MLKYIFMIGLGTAMAFTTPAKAQDSANDAAPVDMSADQAYLGFGLGYFDIFGSGDGATDFRVEYQSGNEFFWKLKPWAGFEATDDGTIWAGGGVAADFHAAPNIYITPSLGAGLYAQGGSDKDLDSALEFRTQLEGGYEFTNGHRVGAYLSHTSNAGLGDHNPGEETLGVSYHLPVNGMF